MEAQIIVHRYTATKFNKCDTQYQITHSLPITSALTERVRVEAFQGYSNARNLSEYFRLRGATNWKDGKQVTGLWKTQRAQIFFGNQLTTKGKSLILFRFENDRQTLIVYTYPHGFYPQKDKVEQIVKGLR